MSEQMLQIPSVKHYFNQYIYEPLKDKKNIQEIDLIDIKAKLLKAFQQELYGQIVFKLGDKAKDMDPDELANIDGIQNILQQTFRKWRRLCIICSERGLGNYFQLEDLQEALKDGPNTNVTVPDMDEDVTDKLDEVLPEGQEPVYLNETGAKNETDTAADEETEDAGNKENS